jgi:hypothetical protein
MQVSYLLSTDGRKVARHTYPGVYEDKHIHLYNIVTVSDSEIAITGGRIYNRYCYSPFSQVNCVISPVAAKRAPLSSGVSLCQGFTTKVDCSGKRLIVCWKI